MDDINKSTDKIDTENNSFEQDMTLQKLRLELKKSFNKYRKTIDFMASDCPIQCLCLPTIIERCLLDAGLLRVYDLFDCDFRKVKGLGVTRIRDLTSRLDQFFAML